MILPLCPIGNSGLVFLNSLPFYYNNQINIITLLIFINYKLKLLGLFLNIYY